MSRALQSGLIVLLVAALVSGAVVVHYSATQRSPFGQQAPAAAGARGETQPGVASSGPGANRKEAVAFTTQSSDEDAQSVHAWMQKRLAATSDPQRLRRELQSALAQLPQDDRAADGAEADAAFDSLVRAEQSAGEDYAMLVDQASRFLDAYPNSPLAPQVRERFDKYSRAWDDRDFESARDFSLANPESFESRIVHYQAYVERHAAAGRHVTAAREAIDSVRLAWSEHDYRAIYEFTRRYPNDVVAAAPRLRRFREDHPASRHAASVDQFLARYEKAAAPGEYYVRVKSGSFDHSIARALSFGPDLAVEVEVAGVRIGRTPIIANSFDPVWDYEFPQPVRWRIGDPVKIRVIDFDYSNRTILKVEPADDPLALRYLSSTWTAQGHRLTFECGFQTPELPAP